MLNKIIHLSLNNRLAVIIITALLLVAGTLTLMRMEVDIFPDLNAPTVVLMTEAPGMAPEEVEQVVSFPLETAMNGTTGVRRVRSSSTTGFSVVWVEFDWDTDIYRARQIVNEQLDVAMPQLPEGVGTPVMGPPSSILGEMLIIGLQADTTSTSELRRIADRTIRPRLLALKGVSQVAVLGGDAPEFQIRLLPERMQAYGISLEEVLAACEDINTTAGGTTVYDYGNEYIVKAAINTASSQEIGLTPVRSDENGVVTLADIATIAYGPTMPRIGIASVDAAPAVLLTVSKQPAAGTLQLTEQVEEALASLRTSLPADTRVITDIFRQSDFIDNSIGNLQSSLLEGAFFVILVLFIFLMNARTTIISVVALPLSIIISVLILNAMGLTINTMSLGGIAIAIGCLVDDAIVDVENVYKRLNQRASLAPSERKPLKDTIFHASAEVRMPIFNSTLIIAAAFMPLFFLSGMEGRMLIPLGIAFLVSLAASTLVALTLTPVLCYYLLGDRKQNRALAREPRVSRWLRTVYGRALQGALRHGRAVLVATGVLLVLACIVFAGLGSGFLPRFNEGSFTINVSTLPGISLEESDRIGREAERIILDTPEITRVARKTGRAELDEHSLGVNVSEIEAPYVLDRRTRAELSADLRKRLAELPGAVIEIGQPISHRIDAMLSGAQSQIAIKVFGPDLNTLFALGRNIRDAASEVPGIVDLSMEQQMERPQLLIKPRREQLAQYGLTPGAFATTLRTALAGKKIGEVYDDGFAYDLTLIVDRQHTDGIDQIRRLPVDTRLGAVPLSMLADVVVSSGPNTVLRENTQRRLIVSANVEGRDLDGAVADLQQHIAAEVAMPEGYYLSYGGQFENSRSAARTLLLASLGALLIIFMLLYGEFHSAVQSAIIMVNMPLALIGGVILLWLTGGEVNIPAIIGFISLMGISTRNGMLLISRYNALATEGKSTEQCIALGSTDRLLPIIMTALTSAFALIPLAIKAQAPGNEIQAPMAIVILGGLLSSTALNVFVVPVLYRLAARRGR